VNDSVCRHGKDMDVRQRPKVAEAAQEISCSKGVGCLHGLGDQMH